MDRHSITKLTPALVPALALALAAPPAAAQPTKWVTVSPLPGDFIIELPGQPERTVDGSATVYRYAEAPNTPNAVYMGVVILPKPLGEATDAVLHREIHDLPGDCRVSSKTQHDYKPDRKGQPTYRGELARVECSDRKAIVVAYVVGWRVYGVMYLAAKGRYSDAEAERLIKSFVLLRH